MACARRCLALALVVAGPPLGMWAWTPLVAAAGKSDAAIVERADGAGTARVRLSAKAADRLGIRTTPVRDEEGGRGETRRKVIPYSAVLYGLDGKTWTYMATEALVFVRHRVEVAYIQGEVAVLSDGPPAGTAVVSVGGAELLGIELGVGK